MYDTIASGFDWNRAAEELCPVPGFAEEWGSMHKPHDAIKSAWHRVDRRRIGLAVQARAAAKIGGGQ